MRSPLDKSPYRNGLASLEQLRSEDDQVSGNLGYVEITSRRVPFCDLGLKDWGAYADLEWRSHILRQDVALASVHDFQIKNVCVVDLLPFIDYAKSLDRFIYAGGRMDRLGENANGSARSWKEAEHDHENKGYEADQ